MLQSSLHLALRVYHTPHAHPCAFEMELIIMGYHNRNNDVLC